MKIEFLSSVAVIAPDPATSRKLYVDALGLPLRGAYVLVIERTYYAGERAVETADIVFPGDRYELVYRFPVE